LPLQDQLGLTQQNLLAWALQEYSEETKRFFEIFEDGLVGQEMKQQQLHGLDSCRRFANAVHHYAHALAHSADVQSSQYRSSVRLRKSLYSLLLRNVASWRAELQQQQQQHDSVVSATSIRRDWPELLKVVATAGQHILNADSGVKDIIGIDDKRRAADEILLLLEEMLQITHPGQGDAVMLMVADVHQQLSIILLLESDHLVPIPHDDEESSSSSDHHHHQHQQQLLFEALQHAQTSLLITLPIAERSGQHLLMAPLSITATCLSATQQHGEAIGLFEQALQLIEATLGPSHETTAPVLVNFGISLYESGDCGKSLEVLSKATEVALSANMSQQSVIFKRIAHYSSTAALCEMKN
jgi:tetratricopeptide (TPR) repeat protein